MYATKIPIVLFMTAAKIDSEIEVGKCHFILDQALDWQQFYRDHPVAFCVGCDHAERRRLEPVFRQLGFDIWDGPGGNAVTAFIARNQAFHQPFRTCRVSLESEHCRYRLGPSRLFAGMLRR